jgi:rare lipoprotein A (peptidoglycan hydrolase)
LLKLFVCLTALGTLASPNAANAAINKTISNDLFSSSTFQEPSQELNKFNPPGSSQKTYGGLMASRIIHGQASWYGPGFYGNRTANGEIFTGRDMTAAHRSLPFGTKVKVTNLGNGKTAIVRINDDGPYIPGRVIDLSEAAASRLGIKSSGVADVRIEVLN